MQKKNLILALLAGVALSGAAQAALHDRGGGLIYDDVLKVTWLQDANYAKTSGYDADGKMTWVNAVAWADTPRLPRQRAQRGLQRLAPAHHG
jgi:hypothetical protein